MAEKESEEMPRNEECASAADGATKAPAPFSLGDMFASAGKVVGDAIQDVATGAGDVLAGAADAAGDAVSTAAESLHGFLQGRESELEDEMHAQDDEAVNYAVKFLKEVLRLRSVRIDRESFLRAELEKKGVSKEAVQRAVDARPAEADIPDAIIIQIAEETIAFETRKSSALSFAAGLPGGFAMLGTIPADMAQYYVHAFRVMQKLAYLYGWSSFLDDCKEVDDETIALLGTFFGVMLGVAGTAKALNVFALKTVMPSIEKRVAAMALTKTAWYVPLKNTLRLIGVNITKQSMGKAAGKIVPVIGGVISGGLTFVSLTTESNRLRDHLATLPPAKPDSEIVIDLDELDVSDEGDVAVEK